MAVLLSFVVVGLPCFYLGIKIGEHSAWAEIEELEFIEEN